MTARSDTDLQSREVTRRLPQYREVIDLYRRAFPPEERLPLWHMRLMALRRDVGFRAWLDDGALVGLTYTVDSPATVWLFYLAVNDSVRSRGYGSRILNGVRRHAAGRTVVLELEPLDDGAPNLEQRRRRLAFYERGGFALTGYRIHEGDQSYSVMADGVFDPGAFRRLVFRFGLGLRRTSLTRE
ncbi:GNAT family N-acetyltransferase [Actinomyces israelii]|uniref:GNAT family N-acetyltransferase n=1 Tax=Actinomyces israelii TaxID=1659 RepID=A0ABT4ICH5_9ACTO|nr:GNAT family N-acetyltransferase [Actinomyces israelii]MCZ0859446.1 GNAT family N-acetyltransferase [Actinomyces israelii]